jgi:CobQ-like glutamine amidotransferase family enzyme/UDP-N-acetylmuramyl tripeptide synthase
VSTLSRLSGRGSGSIIGGRVALLVCPDLIERLALGKTIAIVSGTNGKTTTTRLLVEALGGAGIVASSPTGSNMPAGIVTALSQEMFSPHAVLEIDEGYVAGLLHVINPKVIVLLNLSRDQLDRVGEVRMIAARWREALATTNATIVANVDDPLVVYSAQLAPNVIWVGAGSHWNNDAFHCPKCDGRIIYEEGSWSCVCGFVRPDTNAEFVDKCLIFANGLEFEVETALPGRFNEENLAMAAVAARTFGVEPATSIHAMSQLHQVAGRFSKVDIAGKQLRLMLAKNPAGWSSLIELVTESDAELLIAINARIADGHDPSWLFDVPFEKLRGRYVIASGDRRYDLAVRLRHAGVDHLVAEASPFVALRGVAEGKVDVIANYTAFQDLRRDLGKRRPLPTTQTPPIAASDGVSEPVRSSGHQRSTPLKIVVIYPELLGTYGDTGNGLVLFNRAQWRGIESELVLAHIDAPVPLDGDIYLIGGGEDGPQVRAAQELRNGGFTGVMTRGAVVFGVCAGYQIMGATFPGSDGTIHQGLELLDVRTVRTTSPRAVGELLGDCIGPGWATGVGVLTGFENHASHTVVGAGADPLMQVRAGVGNNGAGMDGAWNGRAIGSYLHGPALARNPGLADALLSLATERVLDPLDDVEENLLRAERLRAIGNRR